jgi:hypothetical protein
MTNEEKNNILATPSNSKISRKRERERERERKNNVIFSVCDIFKCYLRVVIGIDVVVCLTTLRQTNEMRILSDED